MTVGDEVEVRSTNSNIALFFNKLRSGSFSCRPSTPPPLSPLLSDSPLCCLTDLLQEQWWGTIWLVARLDQNDDWRGNPVVDADWEKSLNCIRQYFKSCFSYAFLSGVWLNMRPEAKSLSCPSPSGPLIQTDSALWKHSCGAIAQKNETSGRRLVLGKHMSHGCVSQSHVIHLILCLTHVGTGALPWRGSEGRPALSGWHRPSASWRGWCWTGEDPCYRTQKPVAQLSEQWGPQQPAVRLWWVRRKTMNQHEQYMGWWWWWCCCTGEHAETNGVYTEESWLSEEGRLDWVMPCECLKWMRVTAREKQLWALKNSYLSSSGAKAS